MSYRNAPNPVTSTPSSSSSPHRRIAALTFQDWWHLTARYTSVIESKDTVRTALRIIAHRGFRHLPVVNDGNRVFGIVSAGDLIELFTSHEVFMAETTTIKRQADRLVSSLNANISTIANTRPVTVARSDTILNAIKLVSEKNIGSLLIVEEKEKKSEGEDTSLKKLIGIVTLRDIVSILAAYSPFGVRVEECMTGRVWTVDEKEDSVYSAMEIMAKEGVRRLPVVTQTKNNEGGRSILGIVTNKMILRYLESIVSYEMLDVGQAITQPVKTVMYSRIPTVDRKEDCGNAAYLMKEMGTGGFAVIDGQELVGVITERDLVRRTYQREGLSFFSELFEKGNARMET